MPEQSAIRVRVLPDGNSHDASIVGWNGRLLEVDLSGASYPLGTLLEIEQGAIVFLGEVQQRRGEVVTVAIEHSVDCERLHSIEEIWG